MMLIPGDVNKKGVDVRPMTGWSFPPHQRNSSTLSGVSSETFPACFVHSAPPSPIYRRSCKEKDHCVFKAGGQGWTSKIWGYTRATHMCPTMASLGRKCHCLGTVLVPIVTEASDPRAHFLPGNWSGTKQRLLALLSRKWQHPCCP